jgi:hypothetical protein
VFGFWSSTSATAAPKRLHRSLLEVDWSARRQQTLYRPNYSRIEVDIHVVMDLADHLSGLEDPVDLIWCVVNVRQVIIATVFSQLLLFQASPVSRSSER